MPRYCLSSLSRTCGLLGLLGAAALGCSDKDPVASSAASCDDFENGGDGTCEGTCKIVNEEFCADRAATPNCANIPAGARIDVCGVAIQPPPKEDDQVATLERSPNVEEYGGTGPVDLSCYFSAGFPDPPDPANSQPVTMTGIAKIFSNGCQSKNLQISVYTVRRGGGADDGQLDQLVGQTVTTPDDCSLDGEPEADIEGCGSDDVRWECRYSYADVPTETELVVVTEGAGWAPIYEYGLFIPNSEVSGGEYDKDVRALADGDYQTIPQTAMGSTITSGRGAVAGEVHDCDNLRVVNAVVDIDASRPALTYFSDNEDKPLPQLGAKSTSVLGLYAALDVQPGPLTVAAAGVVDGQLVGVGFMQVRVFADAVTSVTFRGMKSYQVP